MWMLCGKRGPHDTPNDNGVILPRNAVHCLHALEVFLLAGRFTLWVGGLFCWLSWARLVFIPG